jgi:DNA gyrase subunit A
VVGIAYVSDQHELMFITQQGQTLRMHAGDVRAIGRATQGVRLIGVADGDSVVSVVRLEDQNGDDLVADEAPGDTPDGSSSNEPPPDEGAE